MASTLREPLVPNPAPSRRDRDLFHSRLPFKLNIKRTGLSLVQLMFTDIFQTLLDTPRWKFIVFFFGSYA